MKSLWINILFLSLTPLAFSAATPPKEKIFNAQTLAQHSNTPTPHYLKTLPFSTRDNSFVENCSYPEGFNLYFRTWPFPKTRNFSIENDTKIFARSGSLCPLTRSSNNPSRLYNNYSQGIELSPSKKRCGHGTESSQPEKRRKRSIACEICLRKNTTTRLDKEEIELSSWEDLKSVCFWPTLKLAVHAVALAAEKDEALYDATEAFLLCMFGSNRSHVFMVPKRFMNKSVMSRIKAIQPKTPRGKSILKQIEALLSNEQNICGPNASGPQFPRRIVWMENFYSPTPSNDDDWDRIIQIRDAFRACEGSLPGFAYYQAYYEKIIQILQLSKDDQEHVDRLWKEIDAVHACSQRRMRQRKPEHFLAIYNKFCDLTAIIRQGCLARAAEKS